MSVPTEASADLTVPAGAEALDVEAAWVGQPNEVEVDRAGAPQRQRLDRAGGGLGHNPGVGVGQGVGERDRVVAGVEDEDRHVTVGGEQVDQRASLGDARRPSETEARLYLQWIDNDRQFEALIDRMRDVATKATELIMKEAGSAQVKA